MESRIVCKFQAGLDLQRVVIFQEDNEEKVFWMNLNYLPVFITNHPEIKNVYLFGSQDFLQNIEVKTREREVAKNYTREDCHNFIYNDHKAGDII